MIPISRLPELSKHLASKVNDFEHQFTSHAAPRDTIKELALKSGSGVWTVIQPKLDSAASVTEYGFGAEGADGWTAVLTVEGWLYHRGGVQD